LKHWI